MYKIYLRNIPIFLTETQKLPSPPSNSVANPVMPYMGKDRLFLNYVDTLEKTDKFQSVTFHHKDLEFLTRDFFNLFKIVEAAGGAVLNPQGELLVILRNGYYDLPKGKIETGEAKEAAALREVMEETGLQMVSLQKYLTTTYHIYRDKKNVRVLKPNYWFVMQTNETSVTPQTEEDITAVLWKKIPEALPQNRSLTFASIIDVVEALQEMII